MTLARPRETGVARGAPALAAAALLWLVTGCGPAGTGHSEAPSADPATAVAQPRALPAWALGPFLRPREQGPVIEPRPSSAFACPMRGEPVRWEALHTFNPAAVVRQGRVVVLYRAEDDTGDPAIGGHTSRIGYAESRDGLSFARRETPVLFPARDGQQRYEWLGGCEDPRVVETGDGGYVLTYTMWSRDSPREGSDPEQPRPDLARLGVATSRDLLTWTKHGHAFAGAGGGRFRDHWSKSGSIVVERVGERLVAARLGGRYWMYWGENPLHAATSSDLIHWEPLLDESGELRAIMHPRPGRFDSALVEPGPPALLTEGGIVLVYNGKNAEGGAGDPELAEGAYAGGQVLFDAEEPTRIRERLDQPFFRPELPWEQAGQYAAGTTFLEGLVLFEGRWLLYYGCADSLVGVAVWDPAAPPG
jgi:predicted GH43/DUF377 family glycosyl hydrolase